MPRERQAAYRYLIYWGFVLVRGEASQSAHATRASMLADALGPQRHARSGRAIFHLADLLHNLAQFSMWDFAGFDEERFWSHYDDLVTKNPDCDATMWRLRERFESELMEQSTRLLSQGTSE